MRGIKPKSKQTYKWYLKQASIQKRNQKSKNYVDKYLAVIANALKSEQVSR